MANRLVEINEAGEIVREVPAVSDPEDADSPVNRDVDSEWEELSADKGSKIHLSRFNDSSGDWERVAVMELPAGWHDVAHKYGGGRWRWQARKSGKWGKSGSFAIDESVWPRQPRKELTTLGDRATLSTEIEARLARIEHALSGSDAVQSRLAETIQTAALLAKLGGGNGPSLESQIGLFGKLLEFAKGAVGGDGGGKGWADVVGEVLPDLLQTWQHRNALVAARDREIIRQGGAVPPGASSTPPSPMVAGSTNRKGRAQAMADAGVKLFLSRMIAAARNGEESGFWADSTRALAPAGLVRQIEGSTPAELVARAAELVPGEVVWLKTESALTWSQGYLTALRGEDRTGEAKAGGSGGAEDTGADDGERTP